MIRMESLTLAGRVSCEPPFDSRRLATSAARPPTSFQCLPKLSFVRFAIEGVGHPDTN